MVVYRFILSDGTVYLHSFSSHEAAEADVESVAAHHPELVSSEFVMEVERNEFGHRLAL